MIAGRIDVKRVVVRLSKWEIFGFHDFEFDVEVICLGEVSLKSNFMTLVSENVCYIFLSLSIFGPLALGMIDNPTSLYNPS